jgi:cytochrome b subunit of formate dehydrogenase
MEIAMRDGLLRSVAALACAGLALALAAPTAALGKEKCLACHATVEDAGAERLVVDATRWAGTVHGAAGNACADCHAGKTRYPHEADDPLAACADCHNRTVKAVASGVHAKADAPRANGAPAARSPDCFGCHGAMHALAPSSDEASPVHPKRLAATCGNCHADPALGAAAGVKLVLPLAAYTASIHARGVAAGQHSATCSACHGNHKILPAADPQSRVNRGNVPGTCGDCHADIAKAYGDSVHGVAAARGSSHSPVCTDCHGEHRILGPADRSSPVYATNVPKMTCGRCHGDLRLTEKFGLKNTAVEAFWDSYHGLAGRTGATVVANCASCHGVHDILPSADPRSHVAPANLAATCGSCHPGAGARFAIGAVHVLPAAKSETHPVVYWVRVIYLWLIALLVGGMLLHNGLDLYRKAQHPRLLRTLPIPDRTPVRMGRMFRLCHALFALCFTVLVYTGFALRFPEAWWSRLATFGEPLVDLRGGAHRIAALVMLGVVVLHIVHLCLSRRARACVGELVRPQLADFHEFRERAAYLAGRGPLPPDSPWVGYPEKIEYLAVVWGTLIMAITGFMLWFPEVVLRVAPKWWTDLASVIHLYEAILAALAILVWHLYLVILDPLVYPFDTAAVNGRMTPGRAWERRNARMPGEDAQQK